MSAAGDGGDVVRLLQSAMDKYIVLLSLFYFFLIPVFVLITQGRAFGRRAGGNARGISSVNAEVAAAAVVHIFRLPRLQKDQY